MRRYRAKLDGTNEPAGDILIRLAGLVENKLNADRQADWLRSEGKVQMPFAWIDTCTPLLEKGSAAELIAIAEAAAAVMREKHGKELALIGGTR